MVTGIIGRKVGMTQLFDEDGVVRAATVLKAGPCVVVQAKGVDGDGYEAVQLGLVEERPAKANKPTAGHYKKAGVPPTRIRREVALAPGSEPAQPGDQVLVASVFADGDQVDVIGTSRGKGFQGVMKRHNFKGQPASHGNHKKHRAPGSIGACATPARVFKGMKMAGRMGGETVTIQNLNVIEIDAERGLLLLGGAVPGPKGSVVLVKEAVKSRG